MLDKLDVRIPLGSVFTPEFKEILRKDVYGSQPQFHGSRFYAANVDLRSFGIDAIAHLGYKFGDPASKLEIIETGQKSFPEIADVITSIWQLDPLKLGVMRADVTIDIPHIPVSWFREHTRFRYKQFASCIEKGSEESEVQFVQMGSAKCQTLYAGKRPNLVRIYDKRTELYLKWQRECQRIARFNSGLQKVELTAEEILRHTRPTPTFEEFAENRGISIPADQILTRIERQIGGKIPDAISTVGRLFRALPDFDAFANLEIMIGASQVSRPQPPGESGNPGNSIRDHLAGIGFQTICNELGGLQNGVAYVIKYGNGNGRRVLESIKPYWPSSVHILSTEHIKNAFRDSVQQQLGNSLNEPSEKKKFQNGSWSRARTREYD